MNKQTIKFWRWNLQLLTLMSPVQQMVMGGKKWLHYNYRPNRLKDGENELPKIAFLAPGMPCLGLPLLFRKVSLSCKRCVRFLDLYDCLKYALAPQMIETSWFKQLNLIWSLPPEKIWLKREYNYDLGTLKNKRPNQGLSVQDFLQGQGGMSRQKVLKQAEGNDTPHST